MTGDHSTSSIARYPQLALGLGAVVGILPATVGALAPPGPGADELPSDAISRVNDKVIRVEEFARALQQVADDKRNEMTKEDRVHVLNELIDDELLIQHGVELGLVDSNHTVRQAIAAAMMQSIVSESSSEQPSEDDLRAFYKEHYSQHDVFFFTVVREQVEAAYRRRVEDEARRDYLDCLWEEAEITFSSEAPR